MFSTGVNLIPVNH